MANCLKCNAEIDQKYKYCMDCNNAYKIANGVHVPLADTIKPVPVISSPKAWNDDPVVDALLKINNNLASIKVLLEKQMNNR